MQFKIDPDFTMSEIPSQHSYPGKVEVGKPIRTMGPTMESMKGKNSGGGQSGLGHGGDTTGPAGVRIPGFKGMPMQTMASHPPSVRPSMNSIAMNTRSPMVPASCTTTTFGWVSRAIDRASLSRRPRLRACARNWASLSAPWPTTKRRVI